MSISLSCHNLVDHNLEIYYETFIKENFRRMIVLFIKFINFNYHKAIHIKSKPQFIRLSKIRIMEGNDQY